MLMSARECKIIRNDWRLITFGSIKASLNIYSQSDHLPIFIAVYVPVSAQTTVIIFYGPPQSVSILCPPDGIVMAGWLNTRVVIKSKR